MLEELNKKYNQLHEIKAGESTIIVYIYTKKEEIEELKELIKLSVNEIKTLKIELNGEKNMEKLKWLNEPYIINIETKIDFGSNDLENIEVLCKLPFKNLTGLILSRNKIKNIEVLSQLSFKNSRVLELYGNQIENIEVLGLLPLKDLRELDLRMNKIENIEVLSQLPLKEK